MPRVINKRNTTIKAIRVCSIINLPYFVKGISYRREQIKYYFWLPGWRTGIEYHFEIKDDIETTTNARVTLLGPTVTFRLSGYTQAFAGIPCWGGFANKGIRRPGTSPVGSA
jgi:hypothetical protein